MVKRSTSASKEASDSNKEQDSIETIETAVEGNAPTPPEFYAESDPTKELPEVSPGDPGTYAGEYKPTYKDNSDDRDAARKTSKRSGGARS